MKKLGYILIGLLLLSSFSMIGTGASDSAISWWDYGYGNRQRITINNLAASELEDDYTVKISLDHASLVSAGKSLASGDDLRIVYWNGVSNIELDRISENWNTANTEILFNTQESIPAGGSDSNYYIYYGAPSANSPPVNAEMIYLFYDDFNGDTLSSKWIAIAPPDSSVTVHDGVADMAQGSNTFVAPWLTSAGYNIDEDSIVYTVRSKHSSTDGLEDYYLMLQSQNGYHFSPYARTFWSGNYRGCYGNAGCYQETNVDLGAPVNTDFHVFEIVKEIDRASFYVDGVYGNQIQATLNGPFRFAFYFDHWYRPGNHMYIDYVKVRKYVNPEPVAMLGPEEIPAISATVNIDPDTLNLASAGKWITAYIELPTGYSVDDVDITTVKLQDTFEAKRADVQGNRLMVKFARNEVAATLSEGSAELTVTGKIDSGPMFEGSDTIRVINKGK